jgi:hypothetical protein
MTYFMLGIAVIALAQHENKTIRNGNQLYQDKKVHSKLKRNIRKPSKKIKTQKRLVLI